MNTTVRDGKSHGSVRRTAREVFYTNLMLLGFQPAREEAKHRITITSDIFAVPNKKAFEVVMHFLLQRLNPVMAKEQFRDCWPVSDRKKEQQFRKVVNSWLTHISNDDSDANLPRIVPSMFLSPGGDKFYHLLLHLSTYICKKVVIDENGLKSREFLQHPKLMPSIIHLGPVLSKTQRAATISHRKKFLEAIQYNAILQKEWREIANGLAKEHRVLKKEVKELERQVEDRSKRNHELNGKLGSPMPMKKRTGGRFDGEMEVQALKRAQKVQKVRELWGRLEDFHRSHSQHRQIVDSVLGGMANKYRIDAVDINFQVPALLLNECERQIQRRNAGNTYEGGKLNLLSLLRLSNLSLHLYLEKLQQIRMPRFDDMTPTVATEVHTHHAHLANMQALKGKLVNETIPDLKSSIDELIAELDAEEEPVTQSLPVFADRTSSNGLGLIPPTPALYEFRPEACVQTPPHLREAWNISGAPSMADTPEAVAKLDDAMTKIAMRRAGLVQGTPVSTRGEVRQQLKGESKLPKPITAVKKQGPVSTKRKPQERMIGSNRSESHGKTKVRMASGESMDPKPKQTSHDRVWTPPRSERMGTPPTRYKEAVSLMEEPPMDSVVTSAPRQNTSLKAHDLLAEQIARAVAGDIPQDDLFSIQSPLQSLGLDAFTSKDKISRTPDSKEKDTSQVGRRWEDDDLTLNKQLFHDVLMEQNEEEVEIEESRTIKVSPPSGKFQIETDRPFPGKDRTMFSDNESGADEGSQAGHKMHLDLPESEDSVEDEEGIAPVEADIEGLQKIDTPEEMLRTPSLPMRSRKPQTADGQVKSISPLYDDAEEGEGLASITPPLSLMDDPYSLTPNIKRDATQGKEDIRRDHIEAEQRHTASKSPEVCEPVAVQGDSDKTSVTKELMARLNKLKAQVVQQHRDQDAGDSMTERFSEMKLGSRTPEKEETQQELKPVLNDKYLIKSPHPKPTSHKTSDAFSLDLDDLDLDIQDISATGSPEIGISDIPITLVDDSPAVTPAQTQRTQKAHMSLMSAHMKSQSGHGVETEVMITPPASRDLSPRQRVGDKQPPVFNMQKHMKSSSPQESEEQPVIDTQGEAGVGQRSQNDHDDGSSIPSQSQDLSPSSSHLSAASSQPEITSTGKGEIIQQTSNGEKPQLPDKVESAVKSSTESEHEGEPSGQQSSRSSSSSIHSAPPEQTVNGQQLVDQMKPPKGQISSQSDQSTPSEHTPSEIPSPRQSQGEKFSDTSQHESPRSPPPTPEGLSSSKSGSAHSSGSRSTGHTSPGKHHHHHHDSILEDQDKLKSKLELLHASTQGKSSSDQGSDHTSRSQSPASVEKEGTSTPDRRDEQGSIQAGMDNSQSESAVTTTTEPEDTSHQDKDISMTTKEDTSTMVPRQKDGDVSMATKDDASPMTPQRPRDGDDDKTEISELDIFGLGDESVLIPPSPLPGEGTPLSAIRKDTSRLAEQDPPEMEQL